MLTQYLTSTVRTQLSSPISYGAVEGFPAKTQAHTPIIAVKLKPQTGLPHLRGDGPKRNE